MIAMEGVNNWSVFQCASCPFPYSEKNVDDEFEVRDEVEVWVGFACCEKCG